MKEFHIFSSPFGMDDYNKKSKPVQLHSNRRPQSLEITKENLINPKSTQSFRQESYVVPFLG